MTNNFYNPETEVFDIKKANHQQIKINFNLISEAIYNKNDRNSTFERCFYILQELDTFNQIASLTNGILNVKYQIEVKPNGIIITLIVDCDVKSIPSILINTKYNTSERFKDTKVIKSYLMPQEEILPTNSEPLNLYDILLQKENGTLKCALCKRSLKRNNEIAIFNDKYLLCYGKNCFEKQIGIKNFYNYLIHFEHSLAEIMRINNETDIDYNMKDNNVNKFCLQVISQKVQLKAKQMNIFDKSKINHANNHILEKIVPNLFKLTFSRYNTPDKFNEVQNFYNYYPIFKSSSYLNTKEELQKITQTIINLTDLGVNNYL